MAVHGNRAGRADPAVPLVRWVAALQDVRDFLLHTSLLGRLSGGPLIRLTGAAVLLGVIEAGSGWHWSRACRSSSGSSAPGYTSS